MRTTTRTPTTSVSTAPRRATTATPMMMTTTTTTKRRMNSNTQRMTPRKRKRTEDHKAEELEALTNEIDEESQIVGEVLRIKEDHSDGTLFESLRRLQLMQIVCLCSKGY